MWCVAGGTPEDPGEHHPTGSIHGALWWYLTMGASHHCEHHDFPRVPVRRLPRLHAIAPRWYTGGAIPAGDGAWGILTEYFFGPQSPSRFYYGVTPPKDPAAEAAAAAHGNQPESEGARASKAAAKGAAAAAGARAVAACDPVAKPTTGVRRRA